MATAAPGHDSGLMTGADVADLIGVPLSTLEQWRRLRIGPPAVRIGAAVRWRRRSVEAWIADGGGLEYGISLARPRHEVGDSFRVA